MALLSSGRMKQHGLHVTKTFSFSREARNPDCCVKSPNSFSCWQQTRVCYKWYRPAPTHMQPPVKHIHKPDSLRCVREVGSWSPADDRGKEGGWSGFRERPKVWQRGPRLCLRRALLQLSWGPTCRKLWPTPEPPEGPVSSSLAHTHLRLLCPPSGPVSHVPGHMGKPEPSTPLVSYYMAGDVPDSPRT